MSTLKVNTIQNTSGGSSSTPEQIEQGRAKAWIHFDGQDTVAIRDSFNVSSIADTGTGRYTINFTNSFSNANYCMAGSHEAFSDGVCVVGENALVGFSTSAAAIQTTVYNALSDPARVRVIFIGDN